MERHKKKVLVFGVFDKLHDGHRYFLAQAKTLGDELVVIVARDEMVLALKKKTPTHPLSERMNAIKKENLAGTIFPSDEKPNEWIRVREIQPDVIALGYDQDNLEKALRDKKADFPFDFEIVKIAGHNSDVLHTSLLK